MAKFGYPYNDLVICKDSTDYLAWTKQAAIYIVCTHVYACVSDLYFSVSTTLMRLLHAVLPSYQRVPRQLYANISAEICDETSSMP